MGKTIIYISLFIIFLYNLRGEQGTIDTVYSFKPGTGQNVGQSEEYFPANIFGIPSRNASRNTPESAPEEICSLGKGGEIIVGFTSGPLYDGPGPDFIIFENAFFSPLINGIFAEPAIVSVSPDGINFYEFPYDTTNLDGLAGKTPTFGDQSPYSPTESGGDAFDISELGLEYITHIKIKDISHVVSSDPEHPFYSPENMVTGFDLDAVVGLYLGSPASVNIMEENDIEIIDNGEYLLIIGDFSHLSGSLGIYDINGRTVISKKLDNELVIDKSHLSSGFYFGHILINNSRIPFKFIVL